MVDAPALNLLQQMAMAGGNTNMEPVLQMQRQNALSQLATDPDFQSMNPSDQYAQAAKVTGDAQTAGQFVAGINRGKLDMSNPMSAIKTAVQTGNLPVNEGLTAAVNPMLWSGNALPNAAPPSTTSVSPPPVATPLPPASSPSSPTRSSQAPNGIDYNYLNSSVPPFYRNQVVDVIHGGELAKDVSPKDRTLIMNWAHNADPTFTETVGTMRNKMSTDIASNAPGSQGGQSVQLNSIAGHLYDLHEAAPALNNTANPTLNSITNATVGGGDHWFPGVGGSILHPNQLQGISTYNEILNRASPELNKFYVGGEGDKEGRASMSSSFSDNLPIPVLQDNAKTQLGLVNSKRQSLQSQRDKIMGPATTSVVTPTTQALMDDINGKQLTPVQQTLVNAHRIESNLSPKIWGTPQGYPGMAGKLPQQQPGTATHPHANAMVGQTPPASQVSSQQQPQKVVSQSDIQSWAQKRRMTVDQVAKMAQAKGYTIQ